MTEDSSINKSLDYLGSHFSEMLEELGEFIQIPSISTKSEYSPDMHRCAAWFKQYLQQVGISNSRIIQTDGHPIVFGEHHYNRDSPTLLIYGHYDVQPPEPLNEWKTDPFTCEIRDGTIYARGSCDNKGQLFIILMALRSLKSTLGDIPCNIKFLCEGEEESGSTNVLRLIEKDQGMLAADVALICDTAMISESQPTLVVSLRGIMYAELILRGSNRDLHSGVYGGAVQNPFHVLSSIIAGTHDENGRVTIPGFYDDVIELTQAERQQMSEIPFPETEWLHEIGISHAKSEFGYSVLEGTTIRPTLDVHGIWGGYAGEGVKAVIPREVGAKISTRLVANQDPLKTFALLRKFVELRVPVGMECEMRLIAQGMPVSIQSQHPGMTAAQDALTEVFGLKPYLVREGGSIPIVAAFKSHLGLDAVLMGFALESDALHAPNEHFSLQRLHKGAESVIRFIGNLPSHMKKTK